jgi:hypothetical protein
MARAAGRVTKSAPEPKFLCHYCNKEKKKSEFYTSTDTRVLTGITRCCKECARKIACNYNPYTDMYGAATKDSVIEALEVLDKPFFQSLFESSYSEWADNSTQRNVTSVWDTYIKNVAMPHYRGLRFKDGDLFEKFVEDAKKAACLELQKQNSDFVINSQETDNEFAKNKKDVIRLLGYDPFANEPIEDQPLLYSQLIGYLDLGGDGNEDMMRTSSAITIVRGFLQQAKLDDKITKAMMNTNSSSAELKQLLDSKQKISSTISQLAEQSCLSLKHNKNASKGENTWTGKIKKIKELNLRDGEVNGFDIATCRGMQQVMDLSNASILRQLALDESEYSDIVAEQRKMITELHAEKDGYKEICRILLRENLDLKDLIEEHEININEDLVDLNTLFTPFSDSENDTEEETMEDE